MNYEDYKNMDSNDLAKYCHEYSVSNLEELHKINDCRNK